MKNKTTKSKLCKSTKIKQNQTEITDLAKKTIGA